LTREAFMAWYAKSRGRQGLPLHEHDPAILARVVTLVQAATRDAEARASQPDDLAEAA